MRLHFFIHLIRTTLKGRINIVIELFYNYALIFHKTLKCGAVLGVIFSHEVVVFTLCNSFDQCLI